MKLLPFVLLASLLTAPSRAAHFDVRDHGATGDGKTLDTSAINKAIEAAATAGGGTVHFPAGNYLSFSIRLKSNIALHLDHGAVITAATPAPGFGEYDKPEPNEWGDKGYQDFGHSHWHDALIWGENLENISITGPGRIHGLGLVRGGGGGGGGRRGAQTPAGGAGAPGAASAAPTGTPTTPGAPAQGGGGGGAGGRGGFGGGPGSGNKSISLKNCRNVTLRDFSVLQGGWFALIATGVDNFTIDNLRVDTNRDGFDIDACRNVRISNCSVNAPHDDAIVLKSSYALGEARACENITITNCQVTGYDMGTFLDGTYKRTMERAPDRDGPTGRIKFGTESNGGFKNITISNCVFDRSRGLALETVDGGPIEDITITNITMRDVSNSPIFLRLGNRARGPEGTPVATMRRITISNIVASNVDPRYPIIIAGLPGHPIEDVRLSDIRVDYRGGITMEQVAQQPVDIVNTFFQRTGARNPNNTAPTPDSAGGPPPPPQATPREPYDIPERENGYPEPSMFGLLPAYGLFVRHATNLTVERLEVSFAKEDQRPAVVLMNVAGITFDHAKAERAASAPFFVLRGVKDFSTRGAAGLADTRRASVENESL
ncbi:MAG TPA: glycosyl hydrolase family 28-related protein [Opitutaceae bacterium]|nr:glycosyl hydrolase family 28-related protein [Opitutaceae bacterium]